jgi:hypothetical protein
MEHRIIAQIIKLGLHRKSLPIRIILTIIFAVWLVCSLVLPGMIIPITLIYFTWRKPTKERIQAIVRNRRYLVFLFKRTFGIYKPAPCRVRVK